MNNKNIKRRESRKNVVIDSNNRNKNTILRVLQAEELKF